MTSCRNCKGRATLFICPVCIVQLRDLLDELPWLWDELQTTRTRQDRLTVGAVGRGSNPSPINVGAMTLATEVEEILVRWCDELIGVGLQFLPTGAVVPTGFVGPLLPGWRRLPMGYSGSPPQRARWLAHHVEDIAKQKWSGDLYSDIASLVGDPDHPDTKPGRILLAVNRSERLFAGLCGTVRGHNSKGEAIECANPLYAAEGQETICCPKCECETDVDKNRARCATDRDLMVESKLLETLSNIGEAVPRVTFYKWLAEAKVHIRGYMHQGQLVPHRIRRGDPRVFSISQIRSLRAQEESRKAMV